MRISSIVSFHLSERWKKSSSDCVVKHFCWGCRRNFKLIVLGSQRVKHFTLEGWKIHFLNLVVKGLNNEICEAPNSMTDFWHPLKHVWINILHEYISYFYRLMPLDSQPIIRPVNWGDSFFWCGYTQHTTKRISTNLLSNKGTIWLTHFCY